MVQMYESTDVWWTWITGPRNMAQKIILELENKNNVALFVPDDLPWRHQMRDIIRYEKRYDFDIKFIDASDEFPKELDNYSIGDYIIKKFAKDDDIKYGFRNSGSIQDYISEKKIIENLVLWIKGMNKTQEEKLLDFCRDFKTNGSQGNFVLELKYIEESKVRNFSTINYKEEINESDLMLFNSIILDNECDYYSVYWKRYIANLCSLLCVTDAELSTYLMTSFNFKKIEPIEALKALVSEEKFPRRGGNDHDHILWSVRNGDDNRIINNVWKAQLQVLFPMIEEERMTFIETFYDNLEEALKIPYFDFKTNSTKMISQFDEDVLDPRELELGTIYLMNHLRRNDDKSLYLLYLPNEEIRNRLKLIHDLRNKLAHHECCSVDEVSAFLSKYPFSWE